MFKWEQAPRQRMMAGACDHHGIAEAETGGRMVISQGVKDWVLVIGGGISAFSFAVAAGTFVRNGYVEHDRWRAHLAVQPIAKDADVVLTTLTWHVPPEQVASVIASLRGQGTNPQEAPPNPTMPATTTEPKSTDTLYFVVRNSSFRPAAIAGIVLRDASGKDVQVNQREYAKRNGLPRPIAPWEIVNLTLVFDGADYAKASELVIRDMDDHEVEISLGDRTPWRRWVEFPN